MEIGHTFYSWSTFIVMEAGFLLYVLSSACISWYIFSTLFTIFRPIKSTLYSVFYTPKNESIQYTGVFSLINRLILPSTKDASLLSQDIKIFVSKKPPERDNIWLKFFKMDIFSKSCHFFFNFIGCFLALLTLSHLLWLIFLVNHVGRGRQN